MERERVRHSLKAREREKDNLQLVHTRASQAHPHHQRWAKPVARGCPVCLTATLASTRPASDQNDQKCLQTLPNAPWEKGVAELALVANFWPRWKFTTLQTPGASFRRSTPASNHRELALSVRLWLFSDLTESGSLFLGS